MTASELVDELKRDGVALWIDGGQLRYRAPQGALTAERLAVLRQHREDLLALLAAGAARPGPGEPFPLTEIQASYLVGRRSAFGYGGVGCHGYLELTLDPIDPSRLERALDHLVRRHGMLRAVVDDDGTQRVLPSVPRLAIAVTDLRDADDTELAAALETIRSDMSHRVYDPATWPLFELRVTQRLGHSILHLSVDLLIADLLSVRVLLDELSVMYADPAATLPPLGIEFREYVAGWLDARQGADAERDPRVVDGPRPGAPAGTAAARATRREHGAGAVRPPPVPHRAVDVATGAGGGGQSKRHPVGGGAGGLRGGRRPVDPGQAVHGERDAAQPDAGAP